MNFLFSIYVLSIPTWWFTRDVHRLGHFCWCNIDFIVILQWKLKSWVMPSHADCMNDRLVVVWASAKASLYSSFLMSSWKETGTFDRASQWWVIASNTTIKRNTYVWLVESEENILFFSSWWLVLLLSQSRRDGLAQVIRIRWKTKQFSVVSHRLFLLSK